MNAVLWSRVREIRKHGSFGETMVMRPNRWFQGHESLPDPLPSESPISLLFLTTTKEAFLLET
ncbi:hypothetical protein WG67_02580 [Wolbachia endosymbiont of Drosophila incompta]|nr:hypothetical protein WG67_02580 [Wolbachia endosymbiont of Drosophila incompta]AOV88183.1 hypothetical protein WH35_02560 [Wolbachia endosymbiont of Drosophila incompta]PBD15603.1 hypothetical protein CLD06_05275 [Wolbachia endosymbiont of Drosophila subpulchrella]POG52727.1 hypothetical protein BJE00_01035 [Wolbachia sp. wRi]